MLNKRFWRQLFWSAPPLIILLVIFLVVPRFNVFDKKSQDELRLIMLDVGQGDALFIETPEKHQILIDGGPDDSILEKLALVMPWGDRTIDALILSHPHADHVTGLVQVLKYYQVGNIYYAGAAYSSKVYLEFLRLAKTQTIPLLDVSEISDLVFEDGVKLSWLAPTRSFFGKQLKNVHDSMVVARLTYKNEAVVLTGDLESDLERELISLNKTLTAKVLKIGHHGSRTSTSAAFLSAVDPKFVLISVGAGNPFGHPHREVLRRLERYGIVAFRTDRDRDVIARTNGKGWRITPRELRFFSDFARFFSIRRGVHSSFRKN